MRKLIDKIIKKYSKETVEKYYIEENHTIDECAKYFSISKYMFMDLTKHYNIYKSREKTLERISKTCLEKYGVENALQSEEVKNRLKSNNLQRYGVEYTFQNKNILNKAIETNSKKTEEEKQNSVTKREQTCLEKYGVTTYSQLEECKKKVRATNLELFGVEHIAQTQDYIAKKKKTCLERYGNSNFNNKSKAKQTIKEKYNVDSFREFFNLPEIREKYIQTYQEKYGTNCYTESLFNNYDPIYKQLYHDRDKSIEWLESHPKMTTTELASFFKCSPFSIMNWSIDLKLSSYIKQEKSHYEEELLNYLKDLYKGDIIHNTRKILGNGQEIDIYIPEYNLGIEFNGTYYHSSKFLTNNYHFNKSKLAEEKGIRLIHVWDYEWNDPVKQEIIKSLLNIFFKSKVTKIYARNCEIKEITNKEAKSFNEENHLQGHRNAKITYGLLYDNELVQIMSFSHHNKYEWEIIRECSKLNTQIIGGCSKLFKHFLKTINPAKAFSYCDFNKFTGKSYENLSFKFIGFTGPDMKWVLGNFEKVVNRMPTRNKELKDKATAQLYGAGSKRYLWVKNSEDKPF